MVYGRKLVVSVLFSVSSLGCMECVQPNTQDRAQLEPAQIPTSPAIEEFVVWSRIVFENTRAGRFHANPDNGINQARAPEPIEFFEVIKKKRKNST